MGRHARAVPAIALCLLCTIFLDSASAETDVVEGLAAGNSIMVAAGRTIDRDYFAVAERVEIAGTINGDAHILARHIVVTGTINGDLLASGATVDLVGTVAQNARILSGRLTMTGHVGRNLSVTAGQVHLGGNGSVQGAMIGGGATVQIEAPVAHNLTVAGRRVVLAGPIGGSVNAAAITLDIASTADIAGSVSYLGDHPPTIHEHARVKGPVMRRKFPTLRWPWSEQVHSSLEWIGLGLLGISAASTLLMGLGLIAVFPRAFERTVLQLGSHPAGAGGIGLLTCLLAPLGVGILILSLVGLPLAMILVALSLVVFYAGRIVTMAWIGHSLLAWSGSTRRPYAAFLIGLVLYYGLRVIPVVGTVVGILATVLGLGAIVRTSLKRDETPPAAAPRFMAQEF